jgi:hypothetical protein
MCCSGRAAPGTTSFCGGCHVLVSCARGRKCAAIARAPFRSQVTVASNAGFWRISRYFWIRFLFSLQKTILRTRGVCMWSEHPRRITAADGADFAGCAQILIKKKQDADLVGPCHLREAGFRLRDWRMSPMRCSTRARPATTSACGGHCSFASCAGELREHAHPD